jgi:hypothetical protein
MAVKVCELVAIILSALVLGVFWGPWVGLTRSISSFSPEIFLAVVGRLSRNLAPVMTVLMPLSLLSIVPVLVLSHGAARLTFSLSMAGLALFVVALLVTALIEVPIVKRIETWTVATLPDDWQQLRDRWGRFHLVRIGAALAGLALLVSGAIFE